MGKYFLSFCKNQQAFLNYKKLGIYNTASMEQNRFKEKKDYASEVRRRLQIQ